MLPKIAQRLPKKLRLPDWVYEEADKVDFKNKFWFISWLGRSYYINDVIYREVYITLCNNTYFKFQKNLKTFCIPFREEYTIRHRQGNYYEYLGDFLQSAHNHEKINIVKDILINRIHNGTILNIENTLGNGKTFYPLLNSWLYGDVPCYQVDIENLKFIIPFNVIQAYFYSLSSLTLYYLIYGVFIPGIVKPYEFDDYAVVAYRSSLINKPEARILGKFYFLNKGDIKRLYNIRRSFLKELFDKQRNNKDLKSYILYSLPFEKDAIIKMDLHYHPVDKDGVINMVYAIDNVSLPSGEALFEVENFILDDQDAALKIEDENANEIIQGTSVGYNHNNNGEIVADTLYTNNEAILDVIVNDEGPKFLESPNITDAIPTVIKNNTSFENSFIKHIRDYDELTSNHSNDSDTGLVNLISGISENSDYMRIILSAFDLLEKDKDFACDYIYLKRQGNSVFSYDPLNFTKNGSIVFFRIEYQYQQYCIIASNNESKRIGIIKYIGEGGFDSEHDEGLKNGIIKVIRDHKSNWSLLKTSKLKLYNFMVVDSLNKIKRETFEDSVESLYNRIAKGIKDLTGK
ncbi:UNVERIFIED_CONTAM: hypothetical protein POZ17_22165 [Ralstonia mannitolilytica]